jgi:hypothetical protein
MKEVGLGSCILLWPTPCLDLSLRNCKKSLKTPKPGLGPSLPNPNFSQVRSSS